METDEIRVPEETQETSPSEDKQTPSEAGSEAVETPEEGQIPYKRFKEVIDDKNQLKVDLETLREQVTTLQQHKEEEEEEEPLDWKEARRRTIEKTKAEIKEEREKVADAEKRQEAIIDKSFAQLEAVGQEVSQDMKKAVLRKMVETGSNDVFQTYLDVKEKAIKTGKTEQQKKAGFIPPSHKPSEAGKSTLSYKALRNKPLDDIIAGQKNN